MSQLIYLSASCAAPTTALMDSRRSEVIGKTSHMIHMGFLVFSPVAYYDGLTTGNLVPSPFEFRRYCDSMLRQSNTLVVLRLDGWQNSPSVAHDLNVAAKYNVRTVFSSLDNYDYSDLPNPTASWWEPSATGTPDHDIAE